MAEQDPFDSLESFKWASENDPSLICAISFLRSLEELNFDVAQYILDSGYKINTLVCEPPVSILHWLSAHSGPYSKKPHHRNVEIAKWLIARGADLNAIDHRGQTPIFYAINGLDCIEYLRLLIQSGARVNFPELFEMAESVSTPEIVQLLVSFGCPALSIEEKIRLVNDRNCKADQEMAEFLRRTTPRLIK